eukprot:157837_1
MMYNKVSIASFAVIGGLQIIGIFMLLWVINFYRLRNLTEISARRPKSSVIAGIICTIATAITAPGLLLFLNIESIPHMVGTRTLLYILANTAGPGLYHVLTFRAFIIYFDIKFNEALEDTKWRLHIDPAETNWFLKNRNLWGNPKKLSIILFTHWFAWILLMTIICIAYGDKPNSYARYIIAVSGLTPFIINIVLYFKFPKFFDIFGVYNEIKLTLKVEIIQLSVFYLCALLLGAEPYTYKYVFFMILSGLVPFIFILVIHFRVFKLFHLPLFPFYKSSFIKNVLLMQHEVSFSSHTSLSHSTYSKDERSPNKFRLEHVIIDKHGFDEYAKHLTKEWCIENLLFFMETQEWINSNNIQKNTKIHLTFPDSAPKSKIVYENNNNKYLQAVQLFEKYISNSGYFCINISFSARGFLYDTFGYNDSHKIQESEMVKSLKQNKITNENLFHLFDESRTQILKLLKSAYGRFKRSDAFIKLEQTISESIQSDKGKIKQFTQKS